MSPAAKPPDEPPPRSAVDREEVANQPTVKPGLAREAADREIAELQPGGARQQTCICKTQ